MHVFLPLNASLKEQKDRPQWLPISRGENTLELGAGLECRNRKGCEVQYFVQFVFDAVKSHSDSTWQ